jgi:hypothetical protein
MKTIFGAVTSILVAMQTWTPAVNAVAITGISDGEIDRVIEKSVNDIWEEYDKDSNGTLDKKVEFKRFLENTLLE